MKEFITKGTIKKIKRLKNSYVGNPAYHIVFKTDTDILVGRTATNAILGYECSWTWEGEEKTLAYHVMKNGNLIFDRLVEEVK